MGCTFTAHAARRVRRPLAELAGARASARALAAPAALNPGGAALPPRRAPAGRGLAETDAPFLPPQSRRGRRNEPALVVETLTKLAEIRSLSLEDAAARTYQNAITLFG
mgnify:CR=1 FL=1